MQNSTGNKRELFGWYMYDWANSTFSTSVVSVFLGPYFTSITKAVADSEGMVDFLGLHLFAGSLFPYAISLSVLLQVFILPILGAIADNLNKKKLFLGLTAYTGALATILMYFINLGDYYLAFTLFVIANISFGASIVFYNAYLGEIAESENRDRVSSVGWAYGYIGGGVLLAIHILFFINSDFFGINENLIVRMCLSSVGIWWALFTLFPIIFLRKDNYIKINNSKKNIKIFKSSFKNLFDTIKDARNYPQTLVFLVAYMLYNDGVQSVITLSGEYGHEEIGLNLVDLSTVFLVIQFTAFIGALGFAKISNKFGSHKTILYSLVVWIILIFFSFSFLENLLGFYILGILLSLVLGGTQALSRSLFSSLIPKGKESEYFSVYESSERGTSWLGPLFFGLALQITNSYRLGMMSLLFFFISGFLILRKLDLNKAQRDLINTQRDLNKS